MIPTREAPLTKYLKRGNKEGQPNFSIEKSDYIPANTVFDANNSLFNMSERISSRTGEDLNINKYFNVRISRLANRTNDIELYKRYRINFIDRIVRLDQSEIYFDTSYINTRGYVREFKQFSYTRAFEGKGFDCLGYKFGGVEKTLLVEGRDTIRYVFTLKTKHIGDLQTALLKGKSLKSHWFTVFITPTIPVVSHSKGFSKPFITRFITPFEESGIEIIYMDDILERLSFTHVDKFKFSFTAIKRADKVLEIKQTVLAFREYELNKIQLQEDWDIGVLSKIRFDNWKNTIKAIYLLNAYAEYIDETYYSNIPLVEGMMRELQVGEETIETQIYRGPIGWGKLEVLDIQNPLTMVFKIFQGLSNLQLPPLNISTFEEYSTSVKTTFFGVLDDYREVNRVFNFKDDTYYEIKDYKAEIKTLSVECPKVIDFENTFHTYHKELKAYGTVYDLHREKFENVNMAYPLYITTVSEFVTNSDHFQPNCNIYFYDVKTLCIKIKGLLHSINTENLWDMESYLSQHLTEALFFTNQDYDEMTIRVMLNNLSSSSLLAMQQISMHNYFHLSYGNMASEEPVIDLSHESLTAEVSMEEQLDSVMNDSNDAIYEEGPIHEPEGVISMEEAHDSARREDAEADANDAEADLPSMADISESMNAARNMENTGFSEVREARRRRRRPLTQEETVEPSDEGSNEVSDEPDASIFDAFENPTDES